MEATIRTPEQTVETLNGFFRHAENLLITGDKDRCIEAGKRLAAMIEDPKYAGLGNGIAVTLEAFREGFRVRFAGAALKAVQSKLSELDATGVLSATKAAAHSDKVHGLEAMRAFKPSSEPIAEARILKAEVGDVRREAIEILLGTFTVVRGTDGAETYETIKLERVEVGPLAGKIIASHISGPDNELDFQGFAFVSESGRVNVWKKFANMDPRWKAAVEFVVNGTRDAQLGMAEAYALRSGRCARCGRKLTVPASLHRGYGPDCAAIIGIS